MFQPFDKFVYRLPAFSVNRLMKIFDTEELSGWLVDERIREAVYVGSPDLYKELKKLINDEIREGDKKRKIMTSLVKYLSRMSTRCTPFGLFATCSVGKIDKTTKFDVTNEIVRCTRLDMYYLCALAQLLGYLPDIRREVRYYSNNTLYKVGKCMRYIEYKYINKRRMHTISSVERSKYLDVILKKAASGIMIKEIESYLKEQEIEEPEVQLFIEDLIKSQLLVSELDVNITGEAYLHKIIAILSKMNLEDSTRRLLDSLCSINDLLKKIDMGTSYSLIDYHRIVDVVSDIPVPYTENYLFQVDAMRKSTVATLGKSVITELQSILSFFSKMRETKASSLDSFRTAFYERYEEREIPLAMALDSELGIGYPVRHGIGDISPIVDNLMLPMRKQQTVKATTNVQTLLLKRLLKALKEGASEIVFHSEEFKSVPENWKGFPDTLYAMFQVVKVENGAPFLSIKSIGGDSAANLLSRFAHLDPEMKELVKNISKKESELVIDGILAEIVHLPGSRVGNILSRPHIREHEIVYLTSSDLPEANKIYVDDLMLSCRGRELVLRSKKLNKKILPRLTSAHNYYSDTLPIYRFLCDMQHQGNRTTFGVGWGELEEHLDYRPRIRYDNSILSLASWRVRQDEIIAFSQLSDVDLVNNVTAWRMKRNIPLTALLAEGDNELFIDFHSICSIRAFLSAVKKRPVFQLLEFIFAQDELIVKGTDGEYLNECIVAFYKE
ncbi:lantibiotic dehydratase family protein [Bacteroides sp.]|uniref:lantibiotic dehydratase family protein n=1 Tax=Bacteroides sp. TaxID=29523 RepID=UPI0025C6A12E|nr:lantibiotic dehydratase family protein [Bacteroides sp.]